MYIQMYRKTCEAVKTKEFKDNELPPPSEYGILMSTTAAKHLDDTTLNEYKNIYPTAKK